MSYGLEDNRLRIDDFNICFFYVNSCKLCFPYRSEKVYLQPCDLPIQQALRMNVCWICDTPSHATSQNTGIKFGEPL